MSLEFTIYFYIVISIHICVKRIALIEIELFCGSGLRGFPRWIKRKFAQRRRNNKKKRKRKSVRRKGIEAKYKQNKKWDSKNEIKKNKIQNEIWEKNRLNWIFCRSDVNLGIKRHSSRLTISGGWNVDGRANVRRNESIGESFAHNDLDLSWSEIE